MLTRDVTKRSLLVVIALVLCIRIPTIDAYNSEGSDDKYSLTTKEGDALSANCAMACSKGGVNPVCPSPLGCSCFRHFWVRDSCKFEWAIIHSKVRSIRKAELLVDGPSLGEGNYGAVYRATLDGKPVAVKTWLEEKQSRRHYDNFIQETDLIAEVDYNPKVVKLIGRVMITPNVSMVTDYADRGCLEDLLRFGGPLQYPYPTLHIARDIAEAMVTLHKHHIVHRDMKSANVLLYSPWDSKLCDLGLSRKWYPHLQESAIPKRWRLEPEEFKMTGDVGTYEWEAPEVLASREYDKSSDLYGYAVILWEMLTGSEVWKDKANASIEVIVDQLRRRPRIPAHTPADFRKLIEDCWAQKPEDRPTFEQVLERLNEIIAQTPDAPNRPLLETVEALDVELPKLRKSLVDGDFAIMERFTALFGNYTEHEITYPLFRLTSEDLQALNTLWRDHPERPETFSVVAALSPHGRNADKILNDTMYQHIVEAIASPKTPEDVLTAALKSYKILSDGNHHSLELEMIPPIIVESITVAMQRFPKSRSIQYSGSRSLLNIGLFDEFRMSLSKVAFPVLIPLVDEWLGDAELMEQVLGAFQNIALSDDPDVPFLPWQTVPATVKAMKAHPKSALVQRSGMGFLRNLCIEDRFHPILKDNGVFELFKPTMLEHWDDTDTLVEAVGALRNAAIFDGQDPDITKLVRATIPKVIESMFLFPRSDELALQAAGTIYNLGTSDEVNIKAALNPKHRLIEALKEAHRRHHRNDRFEQMLANTLDLLNYDSKFKPKPAKKEAGAAKGGEAGSAGDGKSPEVGEGKGVMDTVSGWLGY